MTLKSLFQCKLFYDSRLWDSVNVLHPEQAGAQEFLCSQPQHRNLQAHFWVFYIKLAGGSSRLSTLSGTTLTAHKLAHAHINYLEVAQGAGGTKEG